MWDYAAGASSGRRVRVQATGCSQVGGRLGRGRELHAGCYVFQFSCSYRRASYRTKLRIIASLLLLNTDLSGPGLASTVNKP